MSIDLILEELEKIHEKLDRLLASRGEKEPSECHSEIMGVDSSLDNSKPPEVKPKEEPTETEEVSQDLAQVLLFKETPKAFLVVKHGFQVWVAKSHLENSEGYDLGNTYDLKVKEKSKWVLNKLDWKPFEVFKD